MAKLCEAVSPFAESLNELNSNMEHGVVKMGLKIAPCFLFASKSPTGFRFRPWSLTSRAFAGEDSPYS